MAIKAEVLLGICAAMADYLGTATMPHVHEGLCEAIAYVETLRAFVAASERAAARTSSGLLAPDRNQITLGRIYGVEQHPRILQLVRELSGSGILMAPGEAELSTPEIRPDVDRYLVGQDPRALARFQMLKLAWEYAVDSFGSRQLLFEMYNASTLAVNRGRLMSSYDTSPFIRLAKDLAGIDPER
jgi:4-hydroxyphenylacetate 3-monooxygenase